MSEKKSSDFVRKRESSRVRLEECIPSGKRTGSEFRGAQLTGRRGRRRNTSVLLEESIQGRGVTRGTTGVPVSLTMMQSNRVWMYEAIGVTV